MNLLLQQIRFLLLINSYIALFLLFRFPHIFDINFTDFFSSEKFTEEACASCVSKTCCVQLSGSFFSAISSHGMGFISFSFYFMYSISRYRYNSTENIFHKPLIGIIQCGDSVLGEGETEVK